MMKLIADNTVKTYEFTYLLPEFLTTAEVAKATEEVEKLVKKHKGKIVSTEDWGKKNLSYKVVKGGKKHADALFTHMILEFEPKNVQNFEKGVYLNEGILRHLLVVAEKETKSRLTKKEDKE
ncbi:MAG: 30S ribosomal protein S6 [Candidatus Pacebacteria bacterium]|nr:30S ribosomal protein S6 [Candidatus Paceibacterota bacterium]